MRYWCEMSRKHKVETLRNYNEILMAVEDFIYTFFTKPDLEMRDFVRNSGWSRRSIQRALEHHDKSWRCMLLEARMTNACRLLLENDHMYVSSVAISVGYKQPDQFAKAFRRRTGLSPTEYRERFRTNPAA